ncbi:MAG TPA: DUF4388 domain-containing protein [Vicinamibacteria bacterium]|nr:DUF4388 domain-containing protein [Vicinamibacteria bacterium]
MKSPGRLEDEDVPDLVQELSRERWTGLLHLEKGGDRLGLTFEDGRLVFAAASNPDYRLGPRLLRRGLITLRQMEDAGKAVGPGRRLGTVLVERGSLSQEQLVQGVVEQTRDIILLAFHWTTGEYRLDAGPAAGEAITLGMSAPQLVLDGITQIEEWSRVERGSGGLAARYSPVSGSEGLFRQLTLDVDQAALLRSVKGARDVESLCTESVLNHFEVCRDLWAFRVIGLIRRVEEAAPLDDDGLEYVLSGDGS